MNSRKIFLEFFYLSSNGKEVTNATVYESKVNKNMGFLKSPINGCSNIIWFTFGG